MASDAEKKNEAVITLRRYPEWLGVMCALLCVASGSFCSLTSKWQNYQSVAHGPNQAPKEFEGAVFQTMLMFVSECVCLVLYFVDKAVSGMQKKAPAFGFMKDPDEAMVKQGPGYLWALPAALDLTSTIMFNVATQMTYASTVTMLRNFIIAVTACMQMPLLHKAVKRHEWIGIAVITVAMLLTAIPTFLMPDPEAAAAAEAVAASGGTPASVTRTVIGVGLTILGTTLNAGQLLIEEMILLKAPCAPLRAVGYSGVSGLALAFVAWPMMQKTKLEDVNASFYAVTHNKMLMLISALYIPVAVVFNFTGLATTLLHSGLLRGVCFAMRSPVVWVVSLGLKWQKFDYFSLAAAFVFGLGVLVYVHKLGLEHGSPLHRWLAKPIHCCCTDPKNDAPYDQLDDQQLESGIHLELPQSGAHAQLEPAHPTHHHTSHKVKEEKLPLTKIEPGISHAHDHDIQIKISVDPIDTDEVKGAREVTSSFAAGRRQ